MENIHTPGCSVCAHAQHCLRKEWGGPGVFLRSGMHTDVCENKQESQECVHLWMRNYPCLFTPQQVYGRSGMVGIFGIPLKV